VFFVSALQQHQSSHQFLIFSLFDADQIPTTMQITGSIYKLSESRAYNRTRLRGGLHESFYWLPLQHETFFLSLYLKENGQHTEEKKSQATALFLVTFTTTNHIQKRQQLNNR
jgi:hypothetical protein